MKRRWVFVGITVLALLILGGGVWYAYQKGYIRPSADVGATPAINYGNSSYPLSSGTLDGTVIQSGVIQLESTTK